MNKIDKIHAYIKDNYSFDVWTMCLILGILQYFSENSDGLETICDLLDTINIDTSDIIDIWEGNE